MPRLIVTDSGAAEREISRLLVVDSGGTTRDIQRLFVIDSGGTARQVFQAFELSLDDISAISIGSSGQTVSSSFSLASDGRQFKSDDGGAGQEHATNWGRPVTAGIGSDYEARLTKTSGSDPTSGPSLGVWHNLGSGAIWSWQQAGNGSTHFEGTLEIGLAGTSSGLVSCLVDITADVIGI